MLWKRVIRGKSGMGKYGTAPAGAGKQWRAERAGGQCRATGRHGEDQDRPDRRHDHARGARADRQPAKVLHVDHAGHSQHTSGSRCALQGPAIRQSRQLSATPAPRYDRSGSITSIPRCPRYVRSCSKSGGKADVPGGPSRANFGSSDAHSMILSARIRIVGGTVKFEALAVLRLTTSSNLVGCSTGMSAGFAPLRMRSTISAPRRHCSRWSPGHKAACLRELAVAVDSGQTQAGDDRGNLGPLT